MRKLLVSTIAVLFASFQLVMAQTQINGTVTDGTGAPLPGVSVKVKGSSTGTATHVDGTYSLNVAPDATIEFSFMGFKTQEIAVDGKTTINVTMVEDSELLDEVIVVAYGTAKRSAFTGSASVVNSESLEKRQVTDVTKALSGAVAGVQTLSSNGQPGVSSTVRIRGVGSMNANMDPLYVVDGVAYDGDISSINTQDVASMTVLKDAAAAALYGARGANGVILITTKKGKSGEARISLDARWGVNSRQIKNYDVFTDPGLYMEKVYESIYNSAYYNLGYTGEASGIYANSNLAKSLGYQVYTVPNGEQLIGLDGKINPNAKLGYSDGEYTYMPDDWADGMFVNKLREEYNFSINGGGEDFSYYFSAGYLNDAGIIENSGFKRISSRLSMDYQAKKWLKVGTNLSYTNSNSRYPGEQTSTTSSGNAFYMANNIAPIYPLYVRDAQGSIMRDNITGTKIYDFGDGASTNNTRNWMSMSNPMSDLLYDQSKYLMDIFDGKWFAQITPIEGLTLTANLGLFIDNTRYVAATNRYYGQNAAYGGSSEQDSYRTYSLNRQYLANYQRSFDKHNFDLLLGYEGYEWEYAYHYAYGYNSYQDVNYVVSNVIDRKTGSGARHNYATQGIISRLNYDYEGKYYGSVSFRRDASSRFHPDKRWGNFWSASAAWDISKEDFMSSLSWVNLLKLKASFGQQGNDRLGSSAAYEYLYAYTDQYSITGADGVFSDATLYFKGNPDITWESSNSFNAGVDFALFDNKVNGTVEYFDRTTDDMLYNKPVALLNGYTSIPMNVGSMSNSGLEVELNYTPVETDNFRWTINGNITFLKNKIKKLHADLQGEMISGSRIYKEGKSMYQLYLVEYAGVDPATGLSLFWAEDAEGNKVATSDWGVASSYKKPTGDLLPTAYGGFGTTVDFHGIDFSIQCAYQFGGKIMDSGYQSLMHGGISSDLGQNWHEDILNAWTPENTNTDVPRLDYSDKYANATSDRWLVSSNYLSINNITLGYTLPKNWVEKIGLESFRIYGSADNLAVFSARKGLDPRQSFTSSTTSLYTGIRTVSCGVKLTF
ncbi:MAG: TonB-dependent receptor [Culturomica sp.]|jgi:TonB-linked SusC/RagA family outer membrane protein|nr:TonB-dependent receptor [Culturomica sp.]